MAIHKDLTGDKAIHPAAYVQTSDPGAVGADKQWVDTTTGASLASGWILKFRNAGNAAWTTALDLLTALNLKANLASPTFTGTPTAPTAAPGTGTTQLATTEYVDDAVTVSGGIQETLIDALGDLIYGSAADTAAKLAGNTTATKKFLRQTGTGAVSAAPAWDTIVENDVGASTNDAGNSSTAITVDWSLGRTQKVTLTGNATITHSNMVAGIVYTLELHTGAGSFTATFASTNWAGSAPTVTATASKLDVFTFYKTIGATILGGVFGQDFTP